MVRNNVSIEHARIGFKNFKGEEGKFNPAGRRNFCVFLDDPELANMMKEDGWNVRYLRPLEEEDDPQPYLQVAVSFKNTPPKIIMITSRGRTQLDEDSVNILDWADIKNVDLIIRPYNWEAQGRTGVKGYLKAMYVTVEEDEFELKYADLPDAPDSAQNSIGGANGY